MSTTTGRADVLNLAGLSKSGGIGVATEQSQGNGSFAVQLGAAVGTMLGGLGLLLRSFLRKP